MELAKITLRGQITIPVGIRKKLGVKDGDKVLFIEDDNGRIIIENSVKIVLKEAQEAFKGEAERVGLKNEQDVVDMINEMRQEKRCQNASDA
ncbi:MAG: AbrB/MazE/SpoVT family DNA-binding domain-containing protein [Holophagaceae bacterium]|nr:AbrB/MazE/SpoVT family DNA-binding domain-containing protein [Holophagaceae bacterium]